MNRYFFSVMAGGLLASTALFQTDNSRHCLSVSEMHSIVGGDSLPNRCCLHWMDCNGTASACGDFQPNGSEPPGLTCAHQPWVLINSSNNTKFCQFPSPPTQQSCTQSTDQHLCKQTRTCWYDSVAGECKVVANGPHGDFNVPDSCSPNCL